MEYLALMGNDLRSSLSPALGQHAAFFWSVIAPVGLALIWVGSVFALWETWFRSGDGKASSAGLLLKFFFTVGMVLAILASGSALEYLIFDGGMVHARILGSLVDFIRPRG